MKITAPGVYDISEKEYHADPVCEPSTSSHSNAIAGDAYVGVVNVDYGLFAVRQAQAQADAWHRGWPDHQARNGHETG